MLRAMLRRLRHTGYYAFFDCLPDLPVCTKGTNSLLACRRQARAGRAGHLPVFTGPPREEKSWNSTSCQAHAAATNDARVVHVVALNISTFIYSSAIARAGMMSSSSDDGDELSLSAVRSFMQQQSVQSQVFFIRIFSGAGRGRKALLRVAT